MAGNNNYWATLLTGFGTAAINNYYNKQLMREQNKFNAEQAQLQRDYETEMSNTAYQRAYEDMKKAGLNPNLAGGQGGASTPAGTAATSAGVAPFDLSGAMNANANAAAVQAQIDNMNADTELKGRQTGKTEEEMKSIKIDNQYKNELKKLEIISQQVTNEKAKAEIKNVFKEVEKKEKEIEKMDEEIALLKTEGEIKEAIKKTLTRNRRALAILSMVESATRSIGNTVGAVEKVNEQGIKAMNAFGM